MRRRAIASFIAACALSACASQTAPPAGPAYGMAWFDVEGDGPKLAFGPPDSEAVVMLTCAPHSGEVTVSFFADPKVRTRTLHLRSGDAALRLAVDASPTVFDDLAMEAKLPIQAPLLASFARTGQFAIGAGSATQLPAADPRIVRRFVERCR
jgi:hypothetical protein